MIYTHTRGYYAATTEAKILPFVTTWMDLEGTMLSEGSQTEKDKYGFTYMWNLKTTKQTNKNKTRDQRNGCQREGCERMGGKD